MAAENEALKQALDGMTALTAELEAIKAKLDGQANVAAVPGPAITKNDIEKANARLMEKIPVQFFKDNERYKDDINTIYRGKVWKIKRGIKVLIPRGLANALEDAERQNQAATRASEEFEEAYTKSMQYLQ